MSKLGKLRKFIVVVFAAALICTFAACTAKSAFDFDKAAAIKQAKEVIDVVNTKDYSATYNMFADDAKKLMTVDGLKASLQPILDPTGAFVEYKSAEAIGAIDKAGKKYISVYVKTKYEKITHVYQVSFDTDLNLEGFFVAG